MLLVVVCDGIWSKNFVCGIMRSGVSGHVIGVRYGNSLLNSYCKRQADLESKAGVCVERESVCDIRSQKRSCLYLLVYFFEYYEFGPPVDR